MAWQLILALLALTAIGWWLWRRLEARAAELGANSFEETAQQPAVLAQPPPEASPAASEDPASTPPQEHT